MQKKWKTETRCNVATGVLVWTVEPTRIAGSGKEYSSYLLSLAMEAEMDGEKKTQTCFQFPGVDADSLLNFLQDVIENLKASGDPNIEPYLQELEETGRKCIRKATEPIRFPRSRSSIRRKD